MTGAMARIVLGVVASAGHGFSAEVETAFSEILEGGDNLVLRDVRITWDSAGAPIRLSARFDGVPTNLENGLKFPLYIRGDDPAPGAAPKWCGAYAVSTVQNLTGSRTLTASIRTLERGSQCLPSGINAGKFEDAREEIAAAQLEREREAQRAVESKAAQDRIRRLAAMPRLKRVAERVPLAADEKCLSQTLDALKLEGLEKRKLLHELLTYGCIALVAPEVPIQVIQRRSASVLIEVMDGPANGRRGWIHADWVR